MKRQHVTIGLIVSISLIIAGIAYAHTYCTHGDYNPDKTAQEGEQAAANLESWKDDTLSLAAELEQDYQDLEGLRNDAIADYNSVKDEMSEEDKVAVEAYLASANSHLNSQTGSCSLYQERIENLGNEMEDAETLASYYAYTDVEPCTAYWYVYDKQYTVDGNDYDGCDAMNAQVPVYESLFEDHWWDAWYDLAAVYDILGNYGEFP